MKTAISVPDRLFRSADALARRLRKSRSALYAEALEEYVARHRAGRITERINAALADEEQKPDPFMQAAARRMLKRVEWK